MFSTYSLKPRFQERLRPSVRFLAGARVHPNQVTIAALLLSCVTGALLLQFHQQRFILLILAPVLFIRMALNAVDGMLAREFGQQSRLGAYLNELGDMVSDAALYLPFALVAPFDPAVVVVVVLLAVLSEAAGILGAMIGAARRYDGPMGKSDRALLFGALGLWAGLAALPAWLAWLMPLLALLLAICIVNRVRAGLRQEEDRRA